MQNAWNDLKFALRQLRRSPAFAMTAIVTLALGIGANTAIFSLLDQALLRTLPVQDPSSLVVFKDTADRWAGSYFGLGDLHDNFSYPEYAALRDHGKGLASLAVTSASTVGFTRGAASQMVAAESVSGNYFQTVGVAPALGRMLQAADDGAPGSNPVAVVSYRFWREKLGADPSIVGSTFTMNGSPFQIVGVTAPGFRSAIWGQDTDVFLPISMVAISLPGNDANLTTQYGDKWLAMIGRLAPGFTAEQAAAANASIWHGIRAADLAALGSTSKGIATSYREARLQVLPGARGLSFNRDSLEKPFLAVMAMALLVLLIASVNVASLLMVRSAGRVREFSLRAALGASASRILSQLLLEGMLIGICGGLVGLLLAPLALRALIDQLADLSGRTVYSSAIESRILLFNFGVALLVSLCFSLVPALQARRPDLTSTLRESSSTGAGGLLKLRRVIVYLQIGLSVVLLVGAGLFIRTMQQLRAVDLGFQPTHLLVFNINPVLAGYSAEATPKVQQHVLEELARVPGVQAVAASDMREVSANGNYYGLRLSGYQAPPDDQYQVQYTSATPSYLSSMHVPLLAGRELSEADMPGHPDVALVRESFVKHFCGGSNESCLGRRISWGRPRPTAPHVEIVGVFQDYRTHGVRSLPGSIMLRPLKQNPDAAQIFVYLRTALEPVAAEADVRTAMRRIAPNLPIGMMFTMDQQIDSNLQNDRLITLLATSFGVLATVLAGVGLYGVLAYSTTQRTREIGIRMALGSTRVAVAQLILNDVLRLAALGVVIAVPVAYALSLLVRAQLFGVSAADPSILLGVASVIAVVAVLSAVVPARRAANISPNHALHTE